MGTGKRLAVSATGFPATNQTWRFIQEAWREPLEALAFLAGNKTILSGITVTAMFPNQTPAAYSDGYVSVNGEIMPFVGGGVSGTVTIVEEVENLSYDVDIDNDGEQDSLPGYVTRYMKFGSDGVESFPFSDLRRLKTIRQLSDFTLPQNLVQDANYVHTDNNLTDEMIQVWNALISNVRADWNVSNPQSQAFILNKPTDLLRVIRKGEVYVGDIYVGNSSFNCTFPNIGTTTYMVLGSFEQVSGGDVNVVWGIGTKTANYFVLHTGETYGVGQSLRFRYLLTSMYNNQ